MARSSRFVQPAPVPLVFKARLNPTVKQAAVFASHFGAVRFSYNVLLAWAIDEFERHKQITAYPRPKLSQQSLQKEWTQTLRAKYAPWHQENSCHVYRSAAENLADAYRRFLSSPQTVGHPKWKKRGGKVSYSVPGIVAPLQHGGTALRVPYVGSVRVCERQKAVDWLLRMGAKLQAVTLTTDSTGGVYAIFRLRVSDGLKLAFFKGKLARQNSGFVGVDLGFRKFATLSNGEEVSNPRYYKKLEAKLNKAQRRVANKKKALLKANARARIKKQSSGAKSKSYGKAKLEVTRLHSRMRHQRLELLNKTSRALISNNSTLVIEDLDVAEMKEKFGKDVADTGMAQFRRILTYMGERYGTQVIVADRYFPSSKTCSGCGTVKAKLSLTERVYDCSACGLSLDRDFNAALNLEKWGREYLAQQLPSGETAAARCAEALNGRRPRGSNCLGSVPTQGGSHKGSDRQCFPWVT